MRTSSRGFVPSALAAAALATIAAGLVATPAHAAEQPETPSFLNVTYDGDVSAPDEYDGVSVGTSHVLTFALRTHSVTSGTATVQDSSGKELCTAPILGGTTGIALCTTTAPLSAGTHDVTATSTSDAGTSGTSEVLHVAAYEDGSGTTDPTDPTDPGTPGTEVAAPKTRIAERSGDQQSVFFDTPALGNDGGSGHVKVYDQSGALVQDRSWNGPVSSDGLRLWLSAPHGQKTVYTAEYVTPKGTSPRSEVVLDSSAAELPTPTFAFAPGVQGGKVFLDVQGIPGATATFTDSTGTVTTTTVGSTGNLQFVGTVQANHENTYSIVQTKGGQTSAELTHVVDTRTGGGEQPGAGEGENPGGETPGAGDVAAPVVSAGKVNADGKTATLTVPTVAGTTGKYVFVDEAGNRTEQRIKPTWEYEIPVTTTGAQTITVTKVVDGKTSAPTEFRITGL